MVVARALAAPATMSHQQLVDAARGALHRLAEAPPVGQDAYAAIEEIEGAWRRTPFVVGVRGALPQRTEVFAALGAFDPLGGTPIREVTSVPLRLRRGDVPKLRIVFDDGKSEEVASTAPGPDELGRRVAASRAELAKCEARAATARDQSQGLRVRPLWWQLWLWPIYLFGIVRMRRRRSALQLAETSLEDARARLAEAEHELAVRASAIAAEQLPSRLRDLVTRPRSTSRAKLLAIEVAGGALAHGVEIVELEDASDGDNNVDIVVVAAEGALYVHDGQRGRRLGTLAEAIGALVSHAASGRAGRLVRHAIYALRGCTTTLDETLEQAEADFRARLAKVEAKRIVDRDYYAHTTLLQLQPLVIARTSALIESSLAILAAELGERADRWTNELTDTQTVDDLKAVMGRIDEQSRGDLQQISDDVRSHVTAGIAGSAYDVHADLIADLRSRGLPETPRARAPVRPIEVLQGLASTAGSNLGQGPNWLVGLFRSFDARRSDALAKLKQRTAHFQDVAKAELFDAEPRLHAAVNELLAADLEAALERFNLWVDSEVARETATVARDREALATLVKTRDAAREDARDLTERLAVLELTGDPV